MANRYQTNTNNQMTLTEVGSELSFGTGDFTILARINPITVSYGASSQGTIYSRNYTALEFYIYQGTLAAYVGGTSNPPTAVSISVSTPTAVGVTRSGSSLRVWNNGTFGTASTNSANASGTGAIWIGSRQNDTSGATALNAVVQELGAWNVALTTDEFNAFKAGFPVKRIRPASCVLDIRMQATPQDERYVRTYGFGAGGPSSSLSLANPLSVYG